MAEKQTEHWYERAAECIVREGKSLFWFANEANLGLTKTECDNIARSKGFQDVLRARRNIFHKELAQDPTYTRASVEGQMAYAIAKLLENGAFDKAATAIMSYAKLKGWTNEQTQINIMNELSAADIAKMRDKLKDKMAGSPVH